MLYQLILSSNSKEKLNELIAYIGNDASKFAELMHYFTGKNARISQRSSWAIGHIGEKYPGIIQPYHKELIASLFQQHQHNAIRRNVVRIYQFIIIPEEIESQLYSICFNFILDNNEAIAVRAFSINVAVRIALKYPELKAELSEAISSILPNASSGLKNRGLNTLKILRAH